MNEYIWDTLENITWSENGHLNRCIGHPRIILPTWYALQLYQSPRHDSWTSNSTAHVCVPYVSNGRIHTRLLNLRFYCACQAERFIPEVLVARSCHWIRVTRTLGTRSCMYQSDYPRTLAFIIFVFENKLLGKCSMVETIELFKWRTEKNKAFSSSLGSSWKL